MWHTDVLCLYAAMVLGLFSVGSILFGHFEEHKPKRRSNQPTHPPVDMPARLKNLFIKRTSGLLLR